MGRGDFLLVGRGEVVRFQAAYVSEEDMRVVVMRLRQGNGRWRGEAGEGSMVRGLAGPGEGEGLDGRKQAGGGLLAAAKQRLLGQEE